MPRHGGHHARVSARLFVYLLAVALLPDTASAGGVGYVAGLTSFDPTVKGLPITWAGGQVSYYTDQGDLSPALLHAQADAFVQDAFSPWTAVSTAALAAQKSGELAEDVNGSNVGSTGSLALPADIQPTATDKPIAIVYDADGAVTDALLGANASSDCAANAVIGGPDAFTFDGHFAHALLVINGVCGQTSAQLPALKYRLVRAIGRVLGMGWSQLDDNIITGSPAPVSGDYAGFPLMHPLDPACDPLACLPSPDTLRMDDRAAISRLYPVTSANLSSFSGKQIFQQQTIRIHGSVYFRLGASGIGQPMQGVNVVARWIDPSTGQASRTYAASSVSGFLFRGNAGNAVTGFTDATGLRYDRFGSDDLALEGYFDLAGLELPSGQTSGDFELSVEAVDPAYTGASTVGPYAPAQVSPSGQFTPIVLHGLTAGSDTAQDVIMEGSSAIASDLLEPDLPENLKPVPPAGEWDGTLSGYGDGDYFVFSATPDRSFAFEVKALDEQNQPTVDKTRPALGLWAAGSTGAPLLYSRAFNSGQTGLTHLSGQILQAGDYSLGIADERGDGRPDYAYHARLLYLDQVSGRRIPAGAQQVLRITGTCIRREATATIGGVAAPILSTSAEETFIQTPGLGAGIYTLQVTQGSLSAQALKAITIGTVSSDQLTLVSSANPLIAEGAISPNPIIVKVTDAASQPLAGIPVTFSVSPTVSAITACNAATCTLATDETGKASAQVLIRANTTHTVTASISNGQNVLASLGVRSSSLDIQAMDPTQRLASGVAVAAPLTVRVLSAGSPVSGRQVVYRLTSGTGTLQSSSALTNANGDATVNFTSPGLSSGASASACVDGISPCTSFSLLAIAQGSLQLQVAQGGEQIVAVGAPVATLRVLTTDGNGNPVQAAPVHFQELAWRGGAGDCIPGDCRPGGVTVLYSRSADAVSNGGGLAAFQPVVDTAWGSAHLSILVSAGNVSVSVPIRIIEVLP